MITEIIFAVLIALLITILFTNIFQTTAASWPGFWIYFMIMLLATLAAGRWVKPVGPQAWNVYWLPMLIAAILVALLVLLLSPRVNPKNENIDSEAGIVNREPGYSSSAILWILILILSMVVSISYVFA